jgi:hypothetical protein
MVNGSRNYGFADF